MREVYEGERKVLVFGEGPLHARVMLVGEAPGEREALEGRPFVGRAGKNLDAFLQGAGLKRDELYVTNAVKFRPVRTSHAGRTVNRPPTQEGSAHLCAVAFAGDRHGRSRVRGRWAMYLCAPLPAAPDRWRCTAVSQRRGPRLYPMYHPFRCFITHLCAMYTPLTLRVWRFGWQNKKYNKIFTIFVARTEFHNAGNVYDKYFAYFAVIRRHPLEASTGVCAA